MYKNKTILGLIPARGGSKGIPGKNMARLGNQPLIAWTIEAACKSALLDSFICSTDSQEIRKFVLKHGCEAPFLRPAALAADDSRSIDVALHALGQIEQQFDYILLLQPTSPFRQASEIDGIIAQGICEEADLTVSVSAVKKHPGALYRLENGTLIPWLSMDSEYTRRQDMPATYERNGSLFLARREYLLARRTYHSASARAYLTAGYSCLDIDTPDDLEYANYLVDKGMIE
ncbi:MAG: acylneuraminate cytidylyltransferase family protein [Azonexus sp.]|jgi:CMP-N,N'-diacetyllegionaminic acid synthase|nr:acylneuraminate cytidylyltransferase family protein [Azonexus sp.]